MFKLSQLPSELYGYIFSFVSSENDLRSLCITCRTFNEEATPHLYRDVHFESKFPAWIETFRTKGSSDVLERLSAFYNTVRASARLAGYVVAFRLASSVSERLYINDRNLYGWLLAVLPQLVNLRSLFLRCVSRETPGFLDVCNFQLSHFHGTFGDEPDLHRFLARQRTLHHLALYPRHRSEVDVPDDVLLNLTILQVPASYLVRWRVPRPIKRAKICFGIYEEDDEVKGMDTLHLYRGTLEVLWLSKPNSYEGSSPYMVMRTALRVPNLSVLILDVNTESIMIDPSEWYQELLRALSGFSSLRAFIVDSGLYSDAAVWWRLCLWEENENIAADIFALLPSVSVIALPIRVGDEGYKIITYVKSSRGSVMKNGVQNFDIDSAWLTL